MSDRSSAAGRPGTGRRVAFVLVLVLGVYLVVVGERAWLLIRDGRVPFVLLGIGVLILPLIGLWIVWQEMRFGSATERLGRQLDAAGELPPDERVRTAGGRLDREAGDAVFARRRAEVEEQPDDWRRWYRLAIAYGDAGDTSRGRQAMRRAIALHDTGPDATP